MCDAVHENWNRYYDPGTGRYLQPEPLLSEPMYSELVAMEGFSAPAFAYAGNNPMIFTDEDGLDSFLCGRDIRPPLSAVEKVLNTVTDPHQYLCVGTGKNMVCRGVRRDPNGGTTRADGTFNEKQCSKEKSNSECKDECVKKAMKWRPKYNALGIGGENCRTWSQHILDACNAKCGHPQDLPELGAP